MNSVQFILEVFCYLLTALVVVLFFLELGRK
jgi:hypothetical protein